MSRIPEMVRASTSRDVGEIVVDRVVQDKQVRIKRLSDLFPELGLQSDRELYHLTASVVESIASRKRFASLSHKSEFINKWFDSVTRSEPLSRLEGLSQALTAYAQSCEERDDCVKWVLDQVVDCAEDLISPTYSRVLGNTYTKRIASAITEHIQDCVENSDLSKIDLLVKKLTS